MDEFSAQMKGAIQSLLEWFGAGENKHHKMNVPYREDVEYGV